MAGKLYLPAVQRSVSDHLNLTFDLEPDVRRDSHVKFAPLVVLLRHLHPPDTGLGANVGVKRTTSKLMVLVELLNLTFDPEPDVRRDSHVKFAPLVVLLRHLHPPDTGLGANVGVKRTTSKLMVLVELLNLTFDPEPDVRRDSHVKFAPLVVLLRHLHPPDTGLGANVGVKRTTSKLMVLVELLNLTFDPEPDVRRVSNVKFAPLVVLLRHLHPPDTGLGANVGVKRTTS
ncbi:hypothetical protein C7450_12339, partial [Chelatococcus asaccharovorans]